ncbi:lamin tail domain-containing protein, partial [Arthrospira platensis SPKY1]|nr:lamin tail domain-containing protein [Arthrospira platensis SPKY1]
MGFTQNPVFMNLPRKLPYLLSLLFLATSLCGTVLINEFMSSNGSVQADEDGDFSDWIELYNSGDEVVNLAGWGLSDDLTRPFRWVFPEITLEP